MVEVNHWRRLIASENGPKSPTTRLILHTLGVHMNQAGGSCFPSTRTLAVECGLSERVVCRHLAIAVCEGWLLRSSAGKSGQAWKRNQYQAAMPKALTQSQHLTQKGTDAKSAPHNEGTDFECKKALTQSQSNYTIELSSNKPRTFLLKDQTEFIIDDHFLGILKKTYPTLNIDAEIQKISAWSYSNPAKRKSRAGAMRFVNGWMQRAVNDNANRQQAPTVPRGFEI
ncbi:MAG: helix-turn-helix domain-containing protein [Desulfobacteraceae bacterium]|nr:helix-turn-helix domain-containing protein [Desulfobacteraceae bacterium]